MARDNHRPSLFQTYRDTGYLFGDRAFTCCRNCARRHNCPGGTTGDRCMFRGRTCRGCTRWNERGCPHFLLDWDVLKT